MEHHLCAEVDVILDFNQLCSYGQGPSEDPTQRDQDACQRKATNVTEEGYPYCAEHVVYFYEALKALT